MKRRDKFRVLLGAALLLAAVAIARADIITVCDPETGECKPVIVFGPSLVVDNTNRGVYH